MHIVDESTVQAQASFAPVMSVADAEREIESLEEFEIEAVGTSRYAVDQ